MSDDDDPDIDDDEPSPHWCPYCGLPDHVCECREFDGPYGDEDEDWDSACADCGRAGTDHCICGAPLCHMCFETGGGFCHDSGDDEHLKLCQEWMGEP